MKVVVQKMRVEPSLIQKMRLDQTNDLKLGDAVGEGRASWRPDEK
jgi:hypothetical protein